MRVTFVWRLAFLQCKNRRVGVVFLINGNACRSRKCEGGAGGVPGVGLVARCAVVGRAHGCSISEESSVCGRKGRGDGLVQAFGAPTRWRVAHSRCPFPLLLEREWAWPRVAHTFAVVWIRLKKEARACPEFGMRAAFAPVEEWNGYPLGILSHCALNSGASSGAELALFRV